MRLRDLGLSDIDELGADLAVPENAWRIAGLERDPSVTTLADCSVEQLTEFAFIRAKSPAGLQFRYAAQTLLTALTNDEAVLQRCRDDAAASWAALGAPAAREEARRPVKAEQSRMKIGGKFIEEIPVRR